MKVTKIKGYQCGECDQIYPDEQDAIDCCPVEIKEVDGWKCGECDEIYEDKEEAKECCK